MIVASALLLVESVLLLLELIKSNKEFGSQLRDQKTRVFLYAAEESCQCLSGHK